jgi:uncharacterized protein DUF6946
VQRLFVPTLGPTDWRRLLADPAVQWEPGKSALEMAVCWEAARNTPRGLPAEVATALDAVPELAGTELLFGIPEHRVSFKGGGHASQNDLWALLRRGSEFFSLAIEAKAGEPLDDLVKHWLLKHRGKTRKPERLEDLQRHLAIDGKDVSELRYQLLHRAAYALAEAARFRCTRAILLIQSFNLDADEGSWTDICRFGDLLGFTISKGQIGLVGTKTTVPLYVGWISCSPADQERLRAAV